jgi:hypothetical protein
MTTAGPGLSALQARRALAPRLSVCKKVVLQFKCLTLAVSRASRSEIQHVWLLRAHIGFLAMIFAARVRLATTCVAYAPRNRRQELCRFLALRLQR